MSVNFLIKSLIFSIIFFFVWWNIGYFPLPFPDLYDKISSGSEIVIFLMFVIFFLFIATVVIASIIDIIFSRNNKEKRKRGIHSLVVVFISMLICLCLSIISLAIQYDRTENAVENMESLIKGIKQYKTANNEYPEKLDDLIPEYINKIPETEMVAYRHISYVRNQKNGFEISINMGGFATMYHLFYIPSENYPEKSYWNGGEDIHIEKIKNWDYRLFSY